jgi:hypothetical protein
MEGNFVDSCHDCWATSFGLFFVMNYYTGVGSRETPAEVLNLMYDLAAKLGGRGYILRSGGADGADKAFEDGCCKVDADMEIYLPWSGFNDHVHNPEKGYFLPDLYEGGEAFKIASGVHPAWDKLTQGAKRLHSRNVFQVLGHDLDTPSKFLVCYAKPVGDSVSGGTRTAVELAKKWNVPVVNLYHELCLDRVKRYLEEE